MSNELKAVKGKKVYAYLPAETKRLVDNIIVELSKEDSVSKLYDHWCNLKDEISMTYTNNPANHVPLVDEKEFTKIKNTVIQYASDIKNSEQKLVDEIEDEDLVEIKMDDVTDFEIEMNRSQPADKILRSSSPKAFSYWSDAYKQGSAYLLGKGVTKDYEKSLKIFSAEANNGNPLAYFDLGMMFTKGLGVEADADIGFQHYKTALDIFIATSPDDPYVQYRIGKMHRDALGTEQNYELSADWMQKSADSGNQYAQYALGGLYFNGLGVSQDLSKAFHLYTDSASQDNAFANYELGKMNRDGIATDVDLQESHRHFVNAYKGFRKIEATDHDPQIQYRLGKMLLQGEGTVVDIPHAVAYMQKAVDSGNEHALFTLTKLHVQKMATIEMTGVLEKLNILATQGNAFAQLSLGYFYLFDQTAQDKEMAKHWLTLSSDQGNAYAKQLLDFMDQSPSPTAAAISLLRALNRIIADDYENKRKWLAQTDRKTLLQLAQKKEAQGKKQTLESMEY